MPISDQVEDSAAAVNVFLAAEDTSIQEWVMMSLRLRVDGVLVAIAAAFCLGGGTAGSARGGDHGSGAVYTLSNEATGNQLVVFQRDHRGGLSLAGTVATGGLGLGTGLASQGSLCFRQEQTRALCRQRGQQRPLRDPARQERPRCDSGHRFSQAASPSA